MFVSIDLIDPNPYRDFHNYPLDESQVEVLRKSIHDLTNFSSMPARPVGDRFQQASGHHRIEAMRRLGMTEVEVTVGDYDDDDMVRMMVVENSTQRGNNAAAYLDGVAAVTRRLAYLMLSTGSWDGLGTIVPGLFDTDHSYQQAIRSVQNGEGLGWRTIRAYAPAGAFSEREVRTAISTLKNSGELTKILVQVEQRLAAEEAARAEKARAEAQQREEERRQAEREAIASRKIAEQRAIEAASAKEEAERKEAESKQRAADAEAARMEADAQAKRERDEHLKKLAAEEKATAERRAAKVKAAVHNQQAPILTTGLAQYFANNNQLASFNKAVLNPDIRPYVTIDRQEALAKEIMEEFQAMDPSDSKATRISGDKIAQRVREKVLAKVRKAKGEDKKREAQLVKQNAVASAHKEMEKINRGLVWVQSGSRDLASLLKSHPGIEEDLGRVQPIIDRIDTTIADLQKLKSAFNNV